VTDKITWQTYDAWENGEDLPPFEIDGVRLVMCCGAFPEAYPDVSGQVVYGVYPGDSYGMFTPEERVEHLPRAVAALIARHKEQA